MGLVMVMGLFIQGYYASSAVADEKPELKGRVFDSEGNVLQGASVFLYDTHDIRRPVDLVSPQTDTDGRFRMLVPPGKYWAVARYKRSGRYGLGPLMTGDKFSGDPVEIELSPGEEFTLDFTVLEITEFARLKMKIREDTLKIQGRILNEAGIPVPMAYAIAHRVEKVSAMPDYLSAWTDNDGEYILYLPNGTYYMGASTKFPPDKGFLLDIKHVLEKDLKELDMVIQSAQDKKDD
jgi:hypothetical protein